MCRALMALVVLGLVLCAATAFDDITSPTALLSAWEARAHGGSTCWREALDALKSGSCRTLENDSEAHKHLALRFLNCQLSNDGLPTYSRLEDLDGASYGVYTQYRIHTTHLCRHIEEKALQERTERGVESLRRTSEDATKSLGELTSTMEGVSKAQIQAASAAEGLRGALVALTAQEDHRKLMVDENLGLLSKALLQIHQEQRALSFHQTQFAKESLGQLEIVSDGTNRVASGVRESLQLTTAMAERGQEVATLIRAVHTENEKVLQGMTMSINHTAQLLEQQQKVLEDVEGVSSHVADLRKSHEDLASVAQTALAHVAQLEQALQRSFRKHQEALEGLRYHTEAASATALEHSLSLQRSHGHITMILEHVASLQSGMARTLFGLEGFLFYTGFVLLIFLLTSVPRTLGARIPGLLIIVICFILDGDDHVVLVRRAAVLLAGVVLLTASYRYRTPEEVHRRIIREEIQHALLYMVRNRDEDDDEYPSQRFLQASY